MSQRGEHLAWIREQGLRRHLARKIAILESDKADLKAQLASLEARYGKVVDQSAKKDGLSSH